MRILQGLGPEYNAISAAIRSCETMITYEELYEKLLDHEVFLKQEDVKQTPPITAAIAQRNNQAPSRNNNNRKQGSNTSQGSQPTIRTFECLCYPWLRPYTKNKFEPHSTPCVYL